MKRSIFILFLLFYTIFYTLGVVKNVSAQNIPGSVDPGRILSDQLSQPDNFEEKAPIVNTGSIDPNIPPGAEKLSFTLKSVQIAGIEAYSLDEFSSLYTDKIGQTVSAAFIWELAGKITDRYRASGFFLSRAFVPPQKIDTGDIKIQIVEGYIAAINIDGQRKNDRIIQSIIGSIQSQKPIKIQHLESQLLRLSDLHGIEYDAILGKKQDGEDGTVTLTLKEKDTLSKRIILSQNNYGSRFVGPNRGNITYQDSFKAYNQTTVSALGTLPDAQELALVSVNHSLQVTPSTELDFLFSKTKSKPGFTLTQSDVESDSISWGIGAKWTPIRQRQRNLTLFTRLNALNSNTDIIDTPFTRDRIRSLSLGAEFDIVDALSAFNTLNVTVTRGLGLFGASDAGDDNLSRLDASPNFTKLMASYTRQNYVRKNIFLTFKITGQIASESLFSAEEFGYGGIDIGRAYDYSEITGDEGISSSLELQYIGIKPIRNININPYTFYDIGKVWNKGNISNDSFSAASAGFGARFYNNNDLNFDATFALPLTKPIDNPLYGDDQGFVIRFGVNKDIKPRVKDDFMATTP